MMTLRHPRLRMRPIVIALLSMASAAAIAEDPQSPEEKNGSMAFPNVSTINSPTVNAAMPVASGAGMRAQKDRNTGQLRAPTAEEAQELDAATPVVTEAPVEFAQQADGSVVARLDSTYLSYSVVSKDANGELIEQCVTGESAADHAVHHAVAEGEVRDER